MTVILSLTTIPERVPTLGRVLDSLVAQVGVPFEVHVNVPPNVTLAPHPDPRVRYFAVEDHGPITKILPTLQRVTDPAQRIVIVDDDFVYHPEMLAVYADYFTRPEFAHAALGFAGLIYNRTDRAFGWVSTLAPGTHYGVEYLQGFKSACYRRDHFPAAFTEGWALAHWNDDFTMGAWLGAADIPAVIISYPRETDLTRRIVSFPIMADIAHEANGCEVFRVQDGGVAASDVGFLDGPMGRYAKVTPLVNLPEPRARGAAVATESPTL